MRMKCKISNYKNAYLWLHKKEALKFSHAEDFIKTRCQVLEKMGIIGGQSCKFSNKFGIGEDETSPINNWNWRRGDHFFLEKSLVGLHPPPIPSVRI